MSWNMLLLLVLSSSTCWMPSMVEVQPGMAPKIAKVPPGMSGSSKEPLVIRLARAGEARSSRMSNPPTMRVSKKPSLRRGSVRAKAFRQLGWLGATAAPGYAPQAQQSSPDKREGPGLDDLEPARPHDVEHVDVADRPEVVRVPAEVGGVEEPAVEGQVLPPGGHRIPIRIKTQKLARRRVEGDD